MRHRITVKPNQKLQRIEKTPDGFLVFLKSPAREGKANQELIKVLVRKLDIAKSRIKIFSGSKSKIKIIEVR